MLTSIYLISEIKDVKISLKQIYKLCFWNKKVLFRFYFFVFHFLESKTVWWSNYVGQLLLPQLCFMVINF